jgi:hypothetical protein
MNDAHSFLSSSRGNLLGPDFSDYHPPVSSQRDFMPFPISQNDEMRRPEHKFMPRD